MNYENLTPDSYLITMPTERGNCVKLEATKYKNGKAVLWAIRDEMNMAMSKKDGLFDYEPNNSSKTDEWFAEYRFEYPQEALDTYLKFYTNVI